MTSRWLRTVAVAALTVGLLAFFWRNAHLGRVWTEIAHARRELLLGAVGITVVTYVLRAVRWQRLLAPVGATRFRSVLRATIIGFAVTFVLPARAGEVVRPYLLARRENLSATAAFATIVIERLLDMMTVAGLFGLAVWAAGAPAAGTDPQLWGAVRWGAGLAALGALGLLGLLVLLTGRPIPLRGWVSGRARWLPRSVARLAGRPVERFIAGCAVLRQPGLLARAVGLSVPLWLGIAAGIWLVTAAFNMRIPPSGTMVLLALLVVGVALPTPGAIGGFHAAFQVGATAFYAVPTDRAVGAALVLHAISFVPVTVVGLIWLIQDGLSLTRLDELASPDRQASVAEASMPLGCGQRLAHRRTSGADRGERR